MTAEEIISRLKTLGYEYTEADADLITFLMAKVKERICNACNLDEVPEGLSKKAVDMVCSEFMLGKMATGQLEDVSGVLKSIAEGDTTVTFADGFSPAEQLKTYLMTLADEKGLARYRKMTW